MGRIDEELEPCRHVCATLTTEFERVQAAGGRRWHEVAGKSRRNMGAKVMTETVFRMAGGKLTGTSVAHYQNAKADSVVRLRTEGTKKP